MVFLGVLHWHGDVKTYFRSPSFDGEAPPPGRKPKMTLVPVLLAALPCDFAPPFFLIRDC